MRLSLLKLWTSAAFLAVPLIASAQPSKLVSEGILGNSGESGKSLVRFGGQFRDARSFARDQGVSSEPGLGVVQDRAGFLWDRAGSETINRYALDGRLVGQYKIPAGVTHTDQMAVAGDTLVMQIRGKLYTLPMTAPSGSEAKALGRDSQLLSFGASNGKVASLQANKIYLLDSAGAATEIAAVPEERIGQIELLPDGTVAIDNGKNLQFWKAGSWQAEKASPGNGMQWIDGFWYGHAWHGTTRRFDAALNPAPGVVLGGASGSFIGHLEGNYEIHHARGLTKINDRLFATSGYGGIVHLLEWQDQTNRFDIVRRIGSVPACRGLALDDKGHVRYGAGSWQWDDGPATPQRQSTPVQLGGPATWLPGGAMLAPAFQYGTRARLIILRDGAVSKNIGLESEDKYFAKGVIGTTLLKENNQFWLLLLNTAGQARAHRVSSGGDYAGESRDVELATTSPIKEWTGLCAPDESTLLGAADGFVIEFKREGAGWKETRRWREWNGDRFGDRIQIAADNNRLWVSDSGRHRVLCFDVKTNNLLAAFGKSEQSGDGLDTLNTPVDIAARGSRAVVYDSANQRLVKLVLK